MREFHEIFVGRTDAYGTYALPKGQTAKKGTKFLGKAKTITSGNLTVENYREHMKGEVGLGVVPIIPPDDNVSWFVIDVDDYIKEKLHEKLASQINTLNLPLVICNSKSFGAHLYCFLTEPAPAKDVIEVARVFCKKLGLGPRTEVFPKQAVSVEAGSWINLPYFGETRVCVGSDGATPLSMKEFLLYVERMEVHPSDLHIRVAEIEERTPVNETGSKAPPCIDTMIKEGVEEGGRDNALVHVAVYMKRAFPDDWQDKLAEFNFEHVNPPLPMQDVFRIIKGGERKDYQYMCKQPPMCSICDKTACFKREFGIGDGIEDFTDFHIDSIRKIACEDPIWIIVIDGTPMRIKTEPLFKYSLFRLEFFKRCNRVLPPMKEEKWGAMLAAFEQFIETEDAPEIVGESGQIRHHFMEWTGQTMQTGNMARVLDGYPVYDEKTITFRGTDFISYLKRTGGRFEDRMVWAVLNEDGAEQKKVRINNSTRHVWSYAVGEPWFDPPENKDRF
jgi:hypothetical protein